MSFNTVVAASLVMVAIGCGTALAAVTLYLVVALAVSMWSLRRAQVAG